MRPPIASCAAVTARLLSWWLGPRLIAWLRGIRLRQEYRDKAEEGGVQHQSKKSGTRTMGGVLIVLVIDLAVLLWAQWNLLIVLTLVPLCANLSLLALPLLIKTLRVIRES